jgi:hypothetical protein
MHLSVTDTILWATSVFGEFLLALILLARRSYRVFPVFFSWVCFVALTEPLIYLFVRYATATTYYRFSFALNVLEYLLELLVLAEIALNVLRPAKQALPRNLYYWVFAVALFVAGGGLLVAILANSATLSDPRYFIVVNMTMAILRLVAFLLIAGFSQLLGLSWKNHVLQLTSGLAFYAILTLVVEFAHSHLHAGPTYASSYKALDHLRIAGYLCALYFWCYAFVKKEAPRKEFSPQMTKILVSISGSTKRQRAVLARTRDQ